MDMRPTYTTTSLAFCTHLHEYMYHNLTLYVKAYKRYIIS